MKRERKKLRWFNFNSDVLLYFYDDSLHQNIFHQFVNSMPRSLAIIFKQTIYLICDYDVMTRNPNLYELVLFSGVDKGEKL